MLARVARLRGGTCENRRRVTVVLLNVSTCSARSTVTGCTQGPLLFSADMPKTTGGDCVATHRLPDTCGQATGEQRIGYFIYGSRLAGVMAMADAARCAPGRRSRSAEQRPMGDFGFKRAVVSRHFAVSVVQPSKSVRAHACVRACVHPSELRAGQRASKALVTHRQGKLPPPRAPSHPQGRPSKQPKV